MANKGGPKKAAYDKAYGARPEQKEARAQRNAARREAEREGKVHKGDGKDVAQEGMMHGYFASASWDIFGFLKAQADYSHMFPSKSDEEELRSAGGTVGIGPQVTSILQNKVSLAEVYWQKERIGLDRWTDSKGDVWADAFFGKSIYTVYGYRIGSQVASGLTLIVDRQTTFTRNKEGKLKSSNQMRIETQMKF